MRLLRVVWFHMRGLFARARLDRELELELRDHIERETRANVARGMSHEEARRAALIDFGGVERYKDEARDVRAGQWFDDLEQDVRYGFRALRHARTFAIVSILTVALGVGVTSAVFSVVDHVLLRPLPFPASGNLYLASYLPADLPRQIPPSVVDRLFLTYQDRQRTFENVAAYRRMEVTLSGIGDAVRVDGARVSADFFTVLRTSPARGRGFTRGDDRVGGDHVAVISDHFWHTRLGADENAIGRHIVLDGSPYTIIGIAPPAFSFPVSSEVWVPMALQLQPTNAFFITVLGRLRQNATPERARAELETIARSLPKDPRDRERPSVARILPLKDVMVGNVERLLLLFAGAVAFVLLIAGVNVTNLLLMRAASRRQELALRVSLGAGRVRLVRQLLTENTLLALLGGVIGVAIAVAGVRALVAAAPDGMIPRLDEVHADPRLLAFTILLSLAVGAVAGLLPAIRSARRDPHVDLAQGAARIAGPRGHLRARFVTTEIALAFVLLAAAGLMIRSFIRMRSIDTGYDANGVITMSVDLPSTTYGDPAQARTFHDRVLAQLARIPGVTAVGCASYRPMEGIGIMGDFKVDRGATLDEGAMVDKPTVSPGYFRAMGIPIARGRDFTHDDGLTAPRVAIVSESVARAIWPGQDPIGKRITSSQHPQASDWTTIVGVVRDVVQDRPLTAHSTLYVPYAQAGQIFWLSRMTYVVRTNANPVTLASAMRQALREVDPTVPAQNVQTMDTSMLQLIAEPLFQTRLLTLFSMLALVLAMIGTYGVLASDVAEHTRELGIRLALGAEPGRVMRLVVGRTARMSGIGIVVGIAGAMLTTRLISRFLFQMSPTDPTTMAIAAGLLAAAALVAGVIPALRASRIDPMVAIRE